MSTPHNRAEKGDFAKTVLMPGDPLRAKFIAETFLENPRLVTDVRGMYGFTGTYQGRPISVMGSGMGMQPSCELNNALRASAAAQNIPLIEGNIHSSDVFYRQPSDAKPTYWEKLRDEKGCLAVEMESFALFHNAKVLGKRAACLLTISDSFVSPEITTAEQRQTSFTEMMKVALGVDAYLEK